MRAALCAIVVAAGLGAPAASAHEDVDTAAGHAAEDAVVHTAADERALTQRTSAASAVGAADAAAAVQGGPQDVGRWGPVKDWPVVGVHVALLPNGKVLAYDSVGDRATETYQNNEQISSRATVWDPQTDEFTDVTVRTGFNIFCSGLAHLTDGRIFTAGGNKDQALHGINKTHTFDPTTNQWTVGNVNMASERWYPTVTPLANGEMLITSGQYQGATDTPEVRQVDGSLRSLTNSSRQLPLYPWMDVAPNGKTFNSGPDTGLQSLSTGGTGAWNDHQQRDGINRTYGSHAMYDIGKILVAGGGDSTKDSRVIDINGATPQVTRTDDLETGRRQHNLTVLADGSVLATGGNSSGAELVDLNNSVYTAELWNPATGNWRTLDAMQTPRQYHSSALLLPDGRVLSSGGGICGICDSSGYLARNGEVFTPPYLFQADGTLAPRPVIDGAPATAGYGGPLTIATANAASIDKVALIRLGAVTHSNNMEQRYVPLDFTKGSGSLTATGPADANIAPPGMYMLVIVDGNGVPSVAKMVKVQAGAPANAAPTVSLTGPANGASFTAPATVNLSASAADSDGSVTKVEFFGDGTKVGEDTSAPYTSAWNGVGAGNHTVTARATDNQGATKTTGATSITVANALPTVTLTSPDDGEHFSAPARVDLAADAADANGAVTKVEFFNGGTKLGEDTTAPYTYTWTGVGAGSRTLTAKATDDAGAVKTSAAVSIIVDTPANGAPTVALTSPASGASFTAPATIDVAATAADGDGTVTRVEFFDGATKLGEDTTAPYTLTWTGVAAGVYRVTAHATDNSGATRVSPASTITVNASVIVPPVVTNPPPADGGPIIVPPPGSPPAPANLAPAVKLTAPKSSTKLTAPATVRLAATASDADGRVVKVEFFRGSTRLGTDTTAPYTHTWSGAKTGTYKLTARATDDRGATRTSAAVTISVRKRVQIKSVAVVESKGARLLRLTTSASTTVRVTLSKRRAASWVELPGKRTAAVRTGRAVVSLRDPWAGRRLTPGKYRVAVRAGSAVVLHSFTIS